jgi:hypothetical protein
MKKLLSIVLLMSAIAVKATAYTSNGVDSWTGGTAPPAGWQSGMTITVSHSITNNTAYAMQLLDGTSTVNIESGGYWKIGSASFADNTSTIHVKSGGVLFINGSFSMDRSTVIVDAGGQLRMNGSDAFYTGGSLTINGTMTVSGNFSSQIAIAGTGVISYGAGSPDWSGGGSFAAGTTTLPVELLNFNATKKENSVLLDWSTATEINSDYYSVMRSQDAVFFESIAKIEAAENSSSIIDYNYSDEFPLKGINYYQLIETDKDGKTQKSKIVALDCSGKMNLITQLYPNPVVDNAALFFSSSRGGVYRLMVSNAGGAIVYSAMIPAMIGENRFSISMEEYAGGVYLITLLGSNTDRSSIQVVKK